MGKLRLSVNARAMKTKHAQQASPHSTYYEKPTSGNQRLGERGWSSDAMPCAMWLTRGTALTPLTSPPSRQTMVYIGYELAFILDEPPLCSDNKNKRE